MKSRWLAGNSARLLENGEQFFPAVFEAIRSARVEVIVETFILFEDKVGMALHQCLVEAAGRGVRVEVLVDGFGSCDLSPHFVESLTAAGVRMRTFDPGSRWLGVRVNVLRRMHRKIVVVDAQRAFVGGINYSADHLEDFGPQAKQDYAVELTGPVVREIHRFAAAEVVGLAPARTTVLAAPRRCPGAAQVDALFVTRDNHRAPQRHRAPLPHCHPQRAPPRADRERLFLPWLPAVARNAAGRAAGRRRAADSAGRAGHADRQDHGDDAVRTPAARWRQDP